MRTFEFRLEWSNPYTEPHGRLPHQILRATATVPGNRGCPAIPQNILRAWRAAPLGYGIHIACVERLQPRKKQRDFQKHNTRLRNLRRRLQKQAPLFQEELFHDAIAQKPEYYGLQAPR